MSRCFYTDEEILEETSRVVNEVFGGMPPTSGEFFTESKFTYNTAYKRFNGYRRLLEAAGFENAGQIRRRTGVSSPGVPTKFENPVIEFPDKKKAEVDWEEWIDHLIGSQKLHRKADATQSEARIKIRCVGPFAVVFSADWHLGSVATEYERWKKDLRFILDTPNMGIITVGDLADNFTRFRTLKAVLDQLVKPEIQGKIIGGVFGQLVARNKILGCWQGNHEAFDSTNIGKTVLYHKALEESIPFFKGKGRVVLDINGTEHILVIMHKSRFHSYLHGLHSSKQEMKQYYPDADIVCTAHTHNPAAERFYYAGKERLALRIGSYKTDDDYSKLYWQPGIIGCPTVVFYNNRWESFSSPYTAKAFMDGIGGGPDGRKKDHNNPEGRE